MYIDYELSKTLLKSIAGGADKDQPEQNVYPNP